MKKQSKKFISALLFLAMVFSLFAAMPLTAYAAPATINIGTTDGGATIGGSAKLTSNPAGQDAWNYDAANKRLYLTAPGGNYTLTGTNSNLCIFIETTATNANITLNGVNITSTNNYDCIEINSNCTVTLLGTNTIVSNNTGFTVWNQVICTINGSGSLTATTTSSRINYEAGIFIDTLTTLRITGTVSVTAEGSGATHAIGPFGSLLLGDTAALSIKNNQASALTRDISRADTGGSSKWRLSGSATTTGLLTAATISVTIPAGTTGTVQRTSDAYKPGDINRDGDVNVLDLSILLANFGKSGAAVTDPRADINNDSDINVLDLSILLANFGK